jgi:hypothetical protein
MPGFGSVGLFGRNPDGEVETQTNRPDEDDETPHTRESEPAGATTPTPEPSPASDGGSATHPATDAGPTPTDETEREFVEAASRRGQPDSYCGNCEHFQYVRVDGDIRPACTLHEAVMDDMDACDQWSPNN